MGSVEKIGRYLLTVLQRKRALGSLGAILLAIPVGCLAAVLLSVLNARSQEEHLQGYIGDTEARVRTSQLILRYLIDQQTGLRGYLLTQDPLFLEPYQTAKRNVPAALAELQRLSPGQEQSIQVIQQLIDQRSALAALLLALGEQFDRAAQLPTPPSVGQPLLQMLKAGEHKTTTIRLAIFQFEQRQHQMLRQQQDKLEQRKQMVDRIQAIGAILSVLTYGGIVILFHLLDREVFQRDQTIQASAATIQTLTDHLVDGVIMLDHQGLIEEFNPAAERILGYESASLWGLALVQVLFPAPEVAALSPGSGPAWAEALLAMGGIHQLQAHHRDGHIIPLELTISRSLAKAPKLIVVIRDISERLNLMHSLEEKIAELAQVNQTLSSTNLALQRNNQSLENFVQAAAHDLRTPLRGIASLAQWIESDIENLLDDENRQYFKLLYQRVLRMQAITNGLLSYVHIDSWIEQRQLVNVGQLIRQICQHLPVPVQFEVRMITAMPVLRTSQPTLQLVFEQLISNVIEHHDRNHGITTIAALPQAETIEFIIQDDGPGIPLAYRERVLRMFQVLENKPDSATRIGIGLALVKKAIDLMGGQLELRSVADSDRGLEVHFTWPVK